VYCRCSCMSCMFSVLKKTSTLKRLLLSLLNSFMLVLAGKFMSRYLLITIRYRRGH